MDSIAAQQYTDLVVLPSLHPKGESAALLEKISGIEFYEERQLYYLLLLAQHPDIRIVFVSSYALPESVVNHYLSVIPTGREVPTAADCRRRLTLVTAPAGTRGPLVSRVANSEAMRRQILGAVRRDHAALVCVNSTGHEERLADQLGIRFLGSLDRHLALGTKSGSRRVFASTGVAHAPGSLLRHSVRTVAEDVYKLWVRLASTVTGTTADGAGPVADCGCLAMPELPRRAVIKLDDGFSGAGNAVMDAAALCDLVRRTPPAERASRAAIDRGVEVVLESFTTMQFQGDGETWHTFKGKMERVGALCEAFVAPFTLTGDEAKAAVRTPSAQVFIAADGHVIVASTHEQVMDASGQVYKGCTYPARDDYRATIVDGGRRVGEAVARTGALGWLSVDFLAVNDVAPLEASAGSGAATPTLRKRRGWRLYALEINLRPGGTTHPFMTAALVSQLTPPVDFSTGRYAPMAGVAIADQRGARINYASSDNMSDPAMRYLTADAALACIARTPELAFTPVNRDAKTGGVGVVLHMLGCLTGDGAKVGATCVAATREQAERMLERAKVELVRAGLAAQARGDAGAHRSKL